MTTNASNTQATYLTITADADSDIPSDNDSVASNATDDGLTHFPEQILTEFVYNSSEQQTWYLIKWSDCPVLRSSWELRDSDLVRRYPGVIESWETEKKSQAEGRSRPLDRVAFSRAVRELELLERNRRKLRRLKKEITRMLYLVES